MTPGRTLRPVSLLVLATGLSGCGAVADDPHRFESMARSVAEVRLDGQEGEGGAMGLRPALPRAKGPLTVQVMDPHDLWDARDQAGVQSLAVQEARSANRPDGLRAALANAPQVVRQTIQTTRDLEQTAATIAGGMTERPASRPRDAGPQAVLQLGAYSSHEAAKSAWSAAANGPASELLIGLSPRLEPAEVDGRRLVRLKVSAPVASARAICKAARVADPWCLRQG